MGKWGNGEGGNLGEIRLLDLFKEENKPGGVNGGQLVGTEGLDILRQLVNAGLQLQQKRGKRRERERSSVLGIPSQRHCQTLSELERGSWTGALKPSFPCSLVPASSPEATLGFLEALSGSSTFFSSVEASFAGEAAAGFSSSGLALFWGDWKKDVMFFCIVFRSERGGGGG